MAKITIPDYLFDELTSGRYKEGVFEVRVPFNSNLTEYEYYELVSKDNIKVPGKGRVGRIRVESKGDKLPPPALTRMSFKTLDVSEKPLEDKFEDDYEIKDKKWKKRKVIAIEYNIHEVD